MLHSGDPNFVWDYPNSRSTNLRYEIVVTCGKFDMTCEQKMCYLLQIYDLQAYA